MKSDTVDDVLGEPIKRFDTHQRLQHLILMVSFILLALTGLPMKFHDWSISQSWIELWGGIENIRTIHYYSALAMVFDVFYHLGYMFWTIVILKRPFPMKMLPSKQDLIILGQEMKYFIGIRKEKPEFDRFNWREKFDYWAIFWGMPVMVLTGFILKFPVFATDYMPSWVVPVSFIAHGDEALLAVSWIVMIHLFFTHFSPGVFPVNTSIFSGKLSRVRYQHEHGLEYQRIIAGEGIEATPRVRERQAPAIPLEYPVPAEYEVAYATDEGEELAEGYS